MATLNPISDTAFYCCGIRMHDAQSTHPICGDDYARLFMDEHGMDIYRRFGGEWAPNASNVSRARYIDDLLRVRLAANPQLQVVLIGCGFDSRAFRLKGGHWFELDEPVLITYKEARLPAAQAGNPLKRIPIDFALDSLREKLEPIGPGPTVVIIEGVIMYVTAEALRATLEVLRARWPTHELIADLMTHHFINTYGRTVKRIIAELGAQMIPGEEPASPFAQAGYRQISSVEIAGLLFRYRGRGWLNVPLRALMPRLYSGYTVRTFAVGGPG